MIFFFHFTKLTFFLKIKLRTPFDAIVGEFNLVAQIGDDREVVPTVLLFNPWCQDDDVYYPKPSDLNEYILRDDGYIWVNSEKYQDFFFFAKFLFCSVDPLKMHLLELGTLLNSMDLAFNLP